MQGVKEVEFMTQKRKEITSTLFSDETVLPRSDTFCLEQLLFALTWTSVPTVGPRMHLNTDSLFIEITWVSCDPCPSSTLAFYPPICSREDAFSHCTDSARMSVLFLLTKGITKDSWLPLSLHNVFFTLYIYYKFMYLFINHSCYSSFTQVCIRPFNIYSAPTT